MVTLTRLEKRLELENDQIKNRSFDCYVAGIDKDVRDCLIEIVAAFVAADGSPVEEKQHAEGAAKKKDEAKKLGRAVNTCSCCCYCCCSQGNNGLKQFCVSLNNNVNTK